MREQKKKKARVASSLELKSWSIKSSSTRLFRQEIRHEQLGKFRLGMKGGGHRFFGY
jgi:hypothetical protein